MPKSCNLRSVPYGDGKKSHTLKTRIITQYKQGSLASFLISNSLYFGTKVVFKFLRKILGIKLPEDLSIIHKDMKVHIVDVGAADGFHPRWKRFGKSAHLSGFEPEDKAFKQLEKLYKNNSKISIYNTMLSNKKEKVTLYLTAWNRGAGLYKPSSFTEIMDSKNMYEIVEEIEFDALPLKDVCEPFDFIKIDTQGHELPILEGAGDLIDQCIGMELEVGFNEKIYNRESTNFGELHNYCREKGFTMCELQNPYYSHFHLPNRNLESKGFVTYSDALYFRFPNVILNLVKDKVFKKSKIYNALALYLSYGNYEFAYILNKDAYKENLIEKESYEVVRSMIKTASGSNKLIPNRIVKHVEGYLSGKGTNEITGY